MISFTVYGKPVPQGSAKAYIPKGWNRAVITSDNKKLKPWRQQVTETALALNAEKLEAVGVEIVLDFYFARPKSAKNRRGMIVKPDVDKLIRAVLDSLTGVLFHDDAQVVNVTARKHYGDPERVFISVFESGMECFADQRGKVIPQQRLAL